MISRDSPATAWRIHQEQNAIDFAGQSVIVTGAGRGLGRLYALELARRGAAVVVNNLGGSMRGDGSDPGVADDAVADWRRMLSVHVDGSFHLSQPAYRVMKTEDYGRQAAPTVVRMMVISGASVAKINGFINGHSPSLETEAPPPTTPELSPMS